MNLSRILRPLCIALGALAVLLGAAPARASLLLSQTPDVAWHTDGMVRAFVQVGNVLYFGGRFTQLREKPICSSGCAGGQVISVSNLASFDATTGIGLSTFHPIVTGTSAVVYDLAVANGVLYVGGRFDAIDGVSVRNLAAIDLTTGHVISAFDPRPDGTVWALAVTPSNLYVGGTFSKIADETHDNLAAFNLPAGTIDSAWDPATAGKSSTEITVRDGRVRDIEIFPDGGILIVGDFRDVTGADGTLYSNTRREIARLLPNGNVDESWAVPSTFFGVQNWGIDVYIWPAANEVFFGTGGSDWVAALNLATGAPIWKTDTVGSSQAVTVIDGTLIDGGHFRMVAFKPGYLSCDANPDPAFCTTRRRIAAFDPSNGHLVDPANGNGTWAPPLTGLYNGVWQAFTDATGHLWIGGELTMVDGVPHDYIARFSNATLSGP